jgi:hypothetical protein
MPKRAIPGVPTSAVEHKRVLFDNAIKENLEVLTGQRGGRIADLPSTATLDDVIVKVNEILARLQ